MNCQLTQQPLKHFKPVGQKYLGSSAFALFVDVPQQKMNVTLFDCPGCSIRDRFTAIFSKPAPPLSYLLDVTPGSLPRICTKVLQTVYSAEGFISGTSAVAILHLQLFHCRFIDEHWVHPKLFD